MLREAVGMKESICTTDGETNGRRERWIGRCLQDPCGVYSMVWYSMHSHERWQHSRIDFTMTGAAMQLAEDGRGRSDGDVRHAHVC